MDRGSDGVKVFSEYQWLGQCSDSDVAVNQRGERRRCLSEAQYADEFETSEQTPVIPGILGKADHRSPWQVWVARIECREGRLMPLILAGMRLKVFRSQNMVDAPKHRREPGTLPHRPKLEARLFSYKGSGRYERIFSFFTP